MEQWIRRLGSALCASLLTVTLNTGIFAEAVENNPADDPLVPFVDDAPEDTDDDLTDEVEEGDDPSGLNDGEESDGPSGLVDGEEGDGPSGLSDGEEGNDPSWLSDGEEGDDPSGLSDGEEGDDPSGLSDDVVILAVSNSDNDGNDDPTDEDVGGDTSLVLFAVNSAPSTDPLSSGSDSGSDDREEQDRTGDPSESEASITINDTVFSPTENSSAEGWKFEDGCLILVNNTSSPSISTVGSALTIKAAGLNHISSLSIDGNIELIGTGILLVDHIEMSEGADFNLRPNSEIYGEDGGGVAVFLNDGDGNYILINGSATAILDENYTIPSGVTLIVPDGSTIVMQTLIVGTYHTTGSEEEQVCYSTVGMADVVNQVTESCGDSLVGGIQYSHSTSPTLTISNGATLVIEGAANLLMNGIMMVGGAVLDPLLDVQGTLMLNGSVTHGSCAVGSSGNVSGPGGFSGTKISISGGRTHGVSELNLAGGSALWLLGEDANIDHVTVSDSNRLVYNGDSTIENLSVVGGTLTCYTTDSYTEEDQLHFGDISGNGSVLLETGIYVLEENCRLDSNTTFVSEGTAAIYDYYLDENGHANLTPNDTPRVMTRDESDVSSTGAQFASVPVVVTRIAGCKEVDGRLNTGFGDCLYDALPGYDYQISQVGTISISYSELVSIWTSDPTHDYYRENYTEKGVEPVILLETVSGGEGGTIVLSSENPNVQVPLSEVRMIRIVEFSVNSNGSGGGVMNSTDTMYTGSGQLGENAGSVVGGNPTSIFSGNGLSNSQPGDPGTGNDPGAGNDPGTSGDTEGSSDGADTDSAEGQLPNASLPEADLWVEETEATDDDCYVLYAIEGEKTLLEYGGEATVSMHYDLPTVYASKPLYAVFRMADGTLKVFRASYDARSGKLSFRTDCLGRFVIVGFDFEGEEFSGAFYEALELWVAQNTAI